MSADSSAVYAPPGYLLFVWQGVLVARRFDAMRGVVTGDPTPVAQSVGVDNAAHGAFSVSNEGMLAYRSVTNARRRLVWVDRAGNELGTVGSADDTGQNGPELSPNEREVAVTRSPQGNVDVWLIDALRSGVESRFTFDSAGDFSPVWSPDGSRLVFRSIRNGRFDLFEKPAHGSIAEKPLLVTSQDKSPQAWSRDGKFLLYANQDPKTQSDLWVLPFADPKKPFPVAQTNFDEIQGQFSPDGHWVAYVSNESGRYEVYIRPFPGPGREWQISTGGGISPRWRNDGKELFYVGPDARMMAVQVQITRDVPVGAAMALFPTRLARGNFGGIQSSTRYAVASDGRFLLNVTVDDAAGSPIQIVQNWTAGLKE